MTRGEIKRRVRLLGQHYFSGDLDLDPFGLDLLITDTANDVARLTDCYIGRRYLDTVAGTSEYCASDLYRVKNIMAIQIDGNYKRLLLIDWYDGKNYLYRQNDSAAIPTHVIIFEGNRIRLHPTPSISTTNGIMMEGWAVPGDVWVYDTNGNPSTTPADQQECPLPNIAHDCVVYGVLAKKAVQQRDMEMVQYYQGQFEQRLGMVESFAATFAKRAT